MNPYLHFCITIIITCFAIASIIVVALLVATAISYFGSNDERKRTKEEFEQHEKEVKAEIAEGRRRIL